MSTADPLRTLLAKVGWVAAVLLSGAQGRPRKCAAGSLANCEALAAACYVAGMTGESPCSRLPWGSHLAQRPDRLRTPGVVGASRGVETVLGVAASIRLGELV